MSITVRHASQRIPRGVWVLGFVSLLMDVSSEMIHALLPVYLVVGLGASALAVGVIEGSAEATASIVRIVSGVLSDRLGRRKPLAALGYGLAALTKPIFPLATSVAWVFAARFIDRIGKGIRGAPRDAWVADLSPPALRGASFGLRQALDSVGAVLGPLAAIGLMWLFADDFVAVFWVAVLPAVLSLALILFAVREPARRHATAAVQMPLARADLRRLGSGYWSVVAVGVLFALARFSEAFLILRAQSIGVPLAWVPAVLVTMNLVYALSAYPAGALSDRVERSTLLAIGLALLVTADILLAALDGVAVLLLGTALWGLHMGCTQGLLAAMIADVAPAELRGTAFGMFHLATGLALLAASVVAGALWQALGARTTFAAGAGFATLTLLALWLLRRRLARRS